MSSDLSFVVKAPVARSLLDIQQGSSMMPNDCWSLLSVCWNTSDYTNPIQRRQWLFLIPRWPWPAGLWVQNTQLSFFPGEARHLDFMWNVLNLNILRNNKTYHKPGSVWLWPQPSASQPLISKLLATSFCFCFCFSPLLKRLHFRNRISLSWQYNETELKQNTSKYLLISH